MADKKRIKTMIETLRAITEPCECGTQRQSYSSAYREGVSYMRREMEDAGLVTREDGVGNLFGRLDGAQFPQKKIMSGSHLDTVRCAGAFDGIAGVVCAVEAARMIRESGCPLRHTYEAVGMVGEEGTRFGKVLLGSQFMAGIYGEPQLDEFVGIEDGKTMRTALKEYGLTGDLTGVSKREQEVLAFVELHGEQGPILERAGTTVGVVDTIVGLAWLDITVSGQTNHSGTVPMDCRLDAGIGAIDLIHTVNGYVCSSYTGKATMTAGFLQLYPNSSNCIPGKCNFTLDIRSGKEEIIEDIVQKVQAQAELLQKDRRLSVIIKVLTRKKPVHLSPRVQSAIEQACGRSGISHQKINSGAGHDSMVFAPLWDTGMIFLPNKDGISHHPDEWISYEDMEKGTDVLYQTIRILDEED